jgi:hypothetical protein
VPLLVFFTNKTTHDVARSLSLALNDLREEHPDLITITGLEWKPVLEDDLFKDIVLDSLRFLANENRVNVNVFAFVIMNNHLHMIWKMLGEHERDDVQRALHACW